MKLLIVDDSGVIRNKIARGAAAKQFDVVGLAQDGEDALRLFEKFQPGVVTMDLTMPRMDGIACIQALLKMRPDTLILVVSALADKATAIEALKRGAHGFVLKPFSDEQIGEALLELLRGAAHG
jgi:two-component system chemotaxis response regulator CheY